jgi:small subunit ribosomal protein S3
MAQKIKPTVLRLGITKDWQNRWFYKRPLAYFLEEDELLRKVAMKKVLAAGIDALEIERLGNDVKVWIRAQRPGLIIGRGGKGIEELKDALMKAVKALRKKNQRPLQFNININIEELRRTDVSASVVAQQVAGDIEKRIPFRSSLRRNLEFLKQNREVKGAKIKVSGRLNGAEISRSDWQIFGSMPLQTLRANIDYGEATSYNTYGTIGVKVWIYKGEIFRNRTGRESR